MLSTLPKWTTGRGLATALRTKPQDSHVACCALVAMVFAHRTSVLRSRLLGRPALVLVFLWLILLAAGGLLGCWAALALAVVAAHRVFVLPCAVAAFPGSWNCFGSVCLSRFPLVFPNKVPTRFRQGPSVPCDLQRKTVTRSRQGPHKVPFSFSFPDKVACWLRFPESVQTGHPAQ